MTTNKPGSVNQEPLYICTSCVHFYEDYTWPADELRVHDNECWCDTCWDERQEDFPDQPGWSDLEPYTPALQAECEKLRTELDAHKAARIAYASEFPLGADGTPDVGSIHENIRMLKARSEKLVEALEQIKAIDDELYGGDWDEIEKARNIANEALATYRNQGGDV